MNAEQIRLTILIIAATLFSGFADAQGFVYAMRIWEGDELRWWAMGRSGLGFMGGMVGFWFVAKFMKLAGVISPEVQTLTWFVVTIVGVALLSGQFLRWPVADQLVAVGVLIGIGWLVWHTGAG